MGAVTHAIAVQDTAFGFACLPPTPPYPLAARVGASKGVDLRKGQSPFGL